MRFLGGGGGFEGGRGLMSSTNLQALRLLSSLLFMMFGRGRGGSGTGGRALLNPSLRLQESLTDFMYPLKFFCSGLVALFPGTRLAAFGQSLKHQP